MLRPLYTNRATRLLLVGPPASGKRTLASQLLRSSKIFYTTKTLEEMDTQCFDRLIDIDFVLIFVDMTNSSSLALLEDTLKYMEPDYLLCKCAVVFTKVDMVNLWMLNEDQIRDIIEQYGNPYTFYVNLKDGIMRSKITEQITRAICVGTFQHRQVHPLGMRLLNSGVYINDINDINDNDASSLQDEHSGQYHFEQYHSEQGHSEEDHSEHSHSEQTHSEQDHSEHGHSEQTHSEHGHSEQTHSEQTHSEQTHSEQNH